MIGTQEYVWTRLAARGPELAPGHRLGHGPGRRPPGVGASGAEAGGRAARGGPRAAPRPGPPPVFLAGPLHDLARAVATMDRMLAVGRAAAAELCRPASGYPGPAEGGGPKPDAGLRLQAENLGDLAHDFAAEGLRLLRHPEDPAPRHAVHEVGHMLPGTDPDAVGLCLDSTRCGGARAAAWWRCWTSCACGARAWARCICGNARAACGPRRWDWATWISRRWPTRSGRRRQALRRRRTRPGARHAQCARPRRGPQAQPALRRGPLRAAPSWMTGRAARRRAIGRPARLGRGLTPRSPPWRSTRSGGPTSTSASSACSAAPRRTTSRRSCATRAPRRPT